jgi:MoaA/NifB/PqqE/SkfB family radical SAM enzyme
MEYEQALITLSYWLQEGLKNVRFSGGEPTLYKELPLLVDYCAQHKVERIAISTNGSASRDTYQKLLDAGANDFSISFDACCASTADIMAGKKGMYNTILDNIRFLSENTYTTVGVVLTNENVQELPVIVGTASALGVSDIRIISAAQWNNGFDYTKDLPKLDMPIYNYRIHNARNGVAMRGLQDSDTCSCPLVLDDIAVVNKYHYPCIIYMREQGDPIGKVNTNMREDRLRWFCFHNTHKDEICKNNCLDVCRDYNNKWKSYAYEETRDIF